MISYIKYKINIFKLKELWNNCNSIRIEQKRQNKPYFTFDSNYRAVKIISRLELNRD